MSTQSTRELLEEFIEENSTDAIEELGVLCALAIEVAEVHSNLIGEFETYLRDKGLDTVFLNSDLAVAAMDILVRDWPKTREIILGASVYDER